MFLKNGGNNEQSSSVWVLYLDLPLYFTSLYGAKSPILHSSSDSEPTGNSTMANLDLVIRLPDRLRIIGFSSDFSIFATIGPASERLVLIFSFSLKLSNNFYCSFLFSHYLESFPFILFFEFSGPRREKFTGQSVLAIFRCVSSFCCLKKWNLEKLGFES